jgi:hypothetical protein
MKRFFLPALLACCCNVYAQKSNIDNYFTGTNTFTEIAGPSHGLSAPHDLDFVPNRPNEWWVLNKEANGGSVVILFNAGLSNQTHQFRRDSHHGHFMVKAVALAFGANEYFATAQEVLNTVGDATTTFMGPALWNSDTSIFARQHQSNWDPNKLLGSHIDMLHQSPYGMGVAHDSANVYWYFDGHFGHICRYDFVAPHGVGEDDHSDGRVYRYTDIPVVRKPNMPSHMAVDHVNKWLYIVDAGNNRVIRMKTTSGTVGATLPVPATSGEPLALYKEVTGATMQVVNTPGLTAPTGIDYRDGRIAVTDNATGNIHVYNVTGTAAQSLGTIATGTAGIMGLRFDNTGRIWFVNKNTKQLFRIDNAGVTNVNDMAMDINYSIYPNPATNVLYVQLNDIKGNEVAGIRIFDMVGKEVYRAEHNTRMTTIKTSNWAKGVYSIMLTYHGTNAVSKLVIQ